MRISWREGTLLVSAVTVAVVALLLVLGAAGRTQGGTSAPGPTSDSVEAGFARDMSAHHAQAVDMAVVARDRSRDPWIRSLALDIALTQQEQIGRMQGWLVDWDLSAHVDEPMVWMRGHHHRAAMPGMASASQLRDLRSATGPDLDRRFVQLMVAHHRGGVAMAREAARRAEVEDVRRLAAQMVRGQRAEIASLEAALDENPG